MAEGEISKELANIKSDMVDLKVHIGDLAKTVTEVAKESGADAKARLELEAQNLMERLKRAIEEAKGQSKRAYDAVEHTVQERPFISLLIAFCLGLLIGKFLLDRK